MARAWHGSHVQYVDHVITAKQMDERVYRPIRMANRADEEFVHGAPRLGRSYHDKPLPVVQQKSEENSAIFHPFQCVGFTTCHTNQIALPHQLTGSRNCKLDTSLKTLNSKFSWHLMFGNPLARNKKHPENFKVACLEMDKRQSTRPTMRDG